MMDERVLIADLESRHPPVLHVRLVAVGDVDVSPATDPALVAVIEPLEPVQIVEIPGGGRALAVDLERVERLVASRVARRLECRERSILKAAEKRAGVVDADRL